MALCEDNLREVRRFLYDFKLKWYDFGIDLGVKVEVLDEIKVNNNNHAGACLREMLRIRLNDVENSLTWKSLADLKVKVLIESPLAQGNMNCVHKFMK